MTILVATTEPELDRLGRRLVELGAAPSSVVAPGPERRVIRAHPGDGHAAESIAVALRAEGEMAVVRPESGAALAAWDRSTTPVVIADRVAVCPAWSEHARPRGPALIELGPGGFGSGHHPTTRMLIEVLARRLTGGESVLDVGCGSGILALAALALGADSALGVDLKPEAVEATRRNAERHSVADRIAATSTPIAHCQDRFAVVLANIARAGIVGSAADLVARVAPGGWLAVSGLSPVQVDDVGGFLRPLQELERLEDGDWAAAVFARPA